MIPVYFFPVMPTDRQRDWMTLHPPPPQQFLFGPPDPDDKATGRPTSPCVMICPRYNLYPFQVMHANKHTNTCDYKVAGLTFQTVIIITQWAHWNTSKNLNYFIHVL